MKITGSIEELLAVLDVIRPRKGQQIVVKLGGSAMEQAESVQATLHSIAALHDLGLKPILVHGGGKAIDRAMKEAGLIPKKIQGRRYTDEQTLAVVVEVLTQEINSDLCRNLQNFGVDAIPVYGDKQVLFGERLLLPGLDLEPIDLGRVGNVNRVETQILNHLTKEGKIPVIPSLAQDGLGWLNVNADTAACAVAAALKVPKLLLMTDTPGILRDHKDPTSLIPKLNRVETLSLIQQGVIDGGMIPKVEACLEALEAGVGSTKIIDGREKYSLLMEWIPNAHAGTEIVLE